MDKVHWTINGDKIHLWKIISQGYKWKIILDANQGD